MNFLRYKNNVILLVLMLFLATSCNDYLDQQPLSSITPDD